MPFFSTAEFIINKCKIHIRSLGIIRPKFNVICSLQYQTCKLLYAPLFALYNANNNERKADQMDRATIMPHYLETKEKKKVKYSESLTKQHDRDDCIPNLL